VSLPRGFREAHETGELHCPHRDVSTCPSCASAHEEIVEVGGQHFWVQDPTERAELQALAAKSKRA
jgi:hypothetical protein